MVTTVAQWSKSELGVVRILRDKGMASHVKLLETCSIYGDDNIHRNRVG